MFGKFNRSKEVEVKEISREELNDLRAARIAEAMPVQGEIEALPFIDPINEGLILSGTGLIKGIEFGPDTMPVTVAVDDLTVVNVPVNTIYPPINAYIGNAMNFQEIHDYNNAQDVYFENSARVLLAERVVFLLNNIIEEFRLVVQAISSDMIKEAKEINKKAGKNCRECDNEYSCADCPAGKPVYITNIFLSSKDVINLIPQLIDVDFYNTIKHNGGVAANKEIIQVTSMAFAGILLNKINVHAIDEIAHIEAMEEVNHTIQLSATKLMQMIADIIQDENIINLIDYNGNYMWRATRNTNHIVEKL